MGWKKILAAVLLGGLVLLCVVYACLDPGASVFFPKCPVKLLTGWQCPSCGVQRALHSFLNGQFAEAVSYNLWFLLSIPYFLLVLTSTLFPSSGLFRRIGRVVCHRYAAYTYIASYFLWWILRNLLQI